MSGKTGNGTDAKDYCVALAELMSGNLFNKLTTNVMDKSVKILEEKEMISKVMKKNIFVMLWIKFSFSFLTFIFYILEYSTLL